MFFSFRRTPNWLEVGGITGLWLLSYALELSTDQWSYEYTVRVTDHEFIPLTRLVPAMSLCLMESAVSLADCIHRGWWLKIGKNHLEKGGGMAWRGESEEEGKPFTLSLNKMSTDQLGKNKYEIRGGKTVHVVLKYLFRSLLQKRVGGVGRSNSFALITTFFPSWSPYILFKDDVTVILLLGVSFLRW